MSAPAGARLPPTPKPVPPPQLPADQSAAAVPGVLPVLTVKQLALWEPPHPPPPTLVPGTAASDASAALATAACAAVATAAPDAV
eukprot:630469-Pleurochrysis_carterae.AAC.1